MERLLTPLVNRWLQKFVKGSQEGAFKASLSGGGGLELHNLDLDLSSALPAGIESRRAFARSLRIKIPWTALNTQPIEVKLTINRCLRMMMRVFRAAPNRQKVHPLHYNCMRRGSTLKHKN